MVKNKKMTDLNWLTKKAKVKDLIKLEINPRKITKEKQAKLLQSLEKFNLVDIPVVNTDFNIIGGNQRVTALMLAGRGEDEIDVRYPNRRLTDKEVKEYSIISNTHAGEFDFDVLDLEFKEIDLSEIGFDILGLDEWSLKQDKILAAEVTEDDFDVPEGGSETNVVLGDLIEIGNHRLLCGDSTDSDQVLKLMNGEKPDMVFTDPPYNIDYQGVKDKREKIANDKMSDEDFTQFLYDALNIDCETFYVCCSWQYSHLFRTALKNLQKPVKSFIVWDKINPAQHLDKYFKQHEIILYH